MFLIFKPFLKIQQNFALVMCRRVILLALFLSFCTVTHAQYVRWMKGTWKSTSGADSIRIDDISRESFTGTKTTVINNSKITISISGAFRGRGFYLQDGEVLSKEPANAQLPDCSACTQTNKMIIGHDSLILISSILDCNSKCDGETFYYRLLSEYDSSTQRTLVDRFGRPSDIIGFRPQRPQEGVTVASNEDNNPDKIDVVAASVVTDEKRAQHINDSIRIAQQRKREADSLNLVKQKQQQRIRDSLDNVARVRQQQIADSTLLAQQKKREQEIADSLNLVRQKEQQRIKDSLDNIARIRQQQIADSTLLAQQKKREQEIADSLNLVRQKEQQRIKDSLDNIARIRQQQIADSTLLAQQKKREQEIADSLNLVRQKEQQRIKDSLDNIARIRQQEITDSLAAVRKQQYNDSLQKAAALAKAVPPPTADSSQSAADKALTSRTSVLLGTYHITSPDILIELFDNAEIDGDRVSVYHNNEMIISNQVLDKKAITLNIHADTTNRQHEFVMVAENLGSIPPNSALMRVTAGKQSYRLSVKTDMKTNARIVFYYDGN